MKQNGCEIIAIDIAEQQKLEDQLRDQTSSDSLTGLANHRRHFEALEAEVTRSIRTARESSLVLLDLYGLKKTNVRFGPLAGDWALCRLGQILKDCSRSVDTAARNGEDEFALVSPETGVATASLVTQRICELLARDAEEPAVSVGTGIASYPTGTNSIGTLLSAAVKPLYATKGNRVEDLAHTSFSTQ